MTEVTEARVLELEREIRRLEANLTACRESRERWKLRASGFDTPVKEEVRTPCWEKPDVRG